MRRTASDAFSWQTASFASVCDSAGRITIRADGTAFPASLDRVTQLADGTLGMVDRSLGRVVLFNQEGVYLGALGRLGDGPGEFRFPADVAKFSDSVIAVVDPAQMRVTLIAKNGAFVRSFRTTGFAGRRIVGLPGKRLAIGGIGEVAGRYKFLAVYDSLGSLEKSALEVPDSLLDLTPRVDDVLVLPFQNEPLLLLSAILPRLYSIDSSDATFRHLNLPGGLWHQLRPMSRDVRTPGDIRAWFDSASVFTAGARLSSDTIVLAWHTGGGQSPSNRLARLSVLQRKGLILPDVPGWVLGVIDTTVWILADQTPDSNVIRTYSCKLT